MSQTPTNCIEGMPLFSLTASEDISFLSAGSKYNELGKCSMNSERFQNRHSNSESDSEFEKAKDFFYIGLKLKFYTSFWSLPK